MEFRLVNGRDPFIIPLGKADVSLFFTGWVRLAGNDIFLVWSALWDFTDA